MSWACLDDGFAEHVKVVDLDDATFRLHVAAMCGCARRGTDGRIGRRDLPALLALVHGAPVVEDLEKAGLWERAEGGWQIHDWFRHNKPAAKVKAEKEATRERVQAWREARKEKQAERRDEGRSEEGNAVRNGSCNALRNAVRTSAPSHPIPSHPIQEELRSSYAGDASHPPQSPRVVAPDLRHGDGERMTPPARIQEAPTAAQGSLLLAEDAPTAKQARRPKSPKALSTTALAWQAYAEAYEARYKTDPAQNSQVMGQLARLVANVGSKAPDLCRYYLTRGDARYRYHPVGMMLSDYQGLLTAMTTGRVITETTARERERAASSPMWQYVADQMDKDRGDVVDVESKPE